MEIIKANIVDLWKSGKIVCVTTNGCIKKDRAGVMGRGNALAMAQLIPSLPSNLGAHLIKHGNNVNFIYERIISFPVKPDVGKYTDVLPHMKYRYKETDMIPGWCCKADFNLIKKSLKQLNTLIERENLEEVYLPIPGVNNGNLKIEEVTPILEGGCKQIKICSL